MDALSLLMNRQSLRDYDERPVMEDVRRKVLQAAVRAPSAGALQLYALIEVIDDSLKRALSVLCDEQPFIARAPWVLVVCADYQRLVDHWAALGLVPSRRPGAGDLLLCVDDALIAAQNAVVAAAALGLGSCYIGDVMEHADQVRAALNLPAYAFPAAMLCFGYPKPGSARPLAPRLPLEAVRHVDGYQKKPVPEGEFARKSIHRALEKFDAEFSYEMNRSVEKWIRQWCGEPSRP